MPNFFLRVWKKLRSSLVLQSSAGMSLVEVMITTVLVAIISMGIGSMIFDLQKGSNSVKYRADSEVLNEEFRSLLSNAQACTNTFGGLTVSATANYPITNLMDGTIPPGAPLVKYKVGGIYGDASVLLKQMNFSGYVPGSTVYNGEMTLFSVMKTNKVASGPQEVTRTVVISLELDGANKILSCVALSKMSDGIWQRTPTKINNIFFKSTPGAGLVAIGTSDPNATLHVNSPDSQAMLLMTGPGEPVGAGPDTASYSAIYLADQSPITTTNSWVLSHRRSSGLPEADSFQIGQWKANSLKANLQISDSTGRVGINALNDPKSALHVNGGIRALGGLPTLGDGSQVGYSFDSDGDTGMFISGNGVTADSLVLSLNMTTAMTFTPTGIGIGLSTPAYPLDVIGTIHASSTVEASDVRLKHDIQILESPLDKILKLRGVSYYWNDVKLYNDKKQIGLIAQEIEKVFPELVDTDHQGYKAVNYSRLVAPLVESVKALYFKFKTVEQSVAEVFKRLNLFSEQIESLRHESQQKEKEIQGLKKENSEIKARLEILEKAFRRSQAQPK